MVAKGLNNNNWVNPSHELALASQTEGREKTKQNRMASHSADQHSQQTAKQHPSGELTCHT